MAQQFYFTYIHIFKQCLKDITAFAVILASSFKEIFLKNKKLYTKYIFLFRISVYISCVSHYPNACSESNVLILLPVSILMHSNIEILVFGTSDIKDDHAHARFTTNGI